LGRIPGLGAANTKLAAAAGRLGCA
jgi:hypothetical protein